MLNTDVKITKLDANGKYISVRQIFREVYVVLLPDEQESTDFTQIYILTLDEGLYIQNITEVKLPVCNEVYISKIYFDRNNDFVVQGFCKQNVIGELVPYTDFKVINFLKVETTPSTKHKLGVVYDVNIDDIKLKAVSKKKDIVHVIGYRQSTNDEIYGQYNSKSQKLNHELAFFSDLGEVYLNEVHCNSDDEVFLVGHIESNCLDKCTRKAFFNKVSQTQW